MTRTALRVVPVLAALLAAGGCSGGATPPAKPAVVPTAEPAETPETPAEPEVKAKPPADQGDDGDEPVYIQGKFVWFELAAANPGKAAGFYASLFGWTTDEVDGEGGKTRPIVSHGTAVGRIVAAGGGRPRGWLVQVSAPELAESLLDAKANGGKVVAEPADAGDGSKLALAADPDGAVFGLRHRGDGDPDDRPAGAGEFHGPFLFASDLDDDYTFYSAVAGYTRDELTVGKAVYIRLVAEELPRGVITKVHKGMRPAWVPMIAVADVAATVAAAKKLKGKALESWDIPQIGKVALLQDPDGATFGVITPVVTADDGQPPPSGGDDDED